MSQFNPPPPRTVRLVERRPRECRLRSADVDYLIREHGSAVEVVPTRQRGIYRLTARGRVGVMLTPGCRLVIRPKLPLKNLFRLLDPAATLDVFEDRSDTNTGTELIDLLAMRLAELLAARGQAGLHRGYVEQRDEQAFLQGRLDVAAQMRDVPTRRTRFHCTREEFTVDGPWNQMPKAVAEALLRSPLPSPNVLPAIQDALAAFREVQLLPLPVAWAAVNDNASAPESYGPLLSLCRLVASGLGPSERSGNVSMPAFLVDLERVFEGFVARAVLGALQQRAGWSVTVQEELRLPPGGPVGALIVLKPDLVVRNRGEPVCVLDTKWKRLGSSPAPDDLSQVLAYGAALGCRDVRLVYPGRRFRALPYDIGPDGFRLTLHTIDIAGSRESSERSVRRLTRSI